MRIVSAFFYLIALPVAASAQLNPLPPASLPNDGVFTRALASDPQQTGWASSRLFDYRLGGAVTRPSEGQVDAFGHSWTNAAPSRQGVYNSGGTLRLIHLGADSQFLDALGYAYDSSPAGADSFTLSHEDGSTSPTGLAFGHAADVSLILGEALNFDFWINSGSRAYTLFDPIHSITDSLHTGSVLWTETPLLIPTYLPALGAIDGVETWIGSLLEIDGNGAAKESRFAVQFYEVNGLPIVSSSPVPEPSTYAFWAAAVCAFAMWRRRARR